ncbi:MAG: hypothetical protein ILO36_09080 [Abditibacteriota bacterium]|nr:hypothetical protein [Abditibacteriota bacterium]
MKLRSLLIIIALAVSGAVFGAPESMDVYDLTHTRKALDGTQKTLQKGWDEVFLVSALQGLANRKAPSLYVIWMDADTYWLDKMTEKGSWMEKTALNTISGLEELLLRHKDCYKGAVIYDPNVPATSCVAATVAGAEDLLPVRYDTSPDSLYSRLVKGSGLLKPVKWLLCEDGASMFTGKGKIPGTDRDSTGSAKCDAYIWAKENYLDKGRCSKTDMGYYIDYYFIKAPDARSLSNSTLVNLDFQIAGRGFVFDLSVWDDETPVDDPDQPLGADFGTFKEILLSQYRRSKGEMVQISGFTPWNLKYTESRLAGGSHGAVETEWHHAELLSNYNCYMDADALGSSDMANASVFSKYPLKKKYPQPKAGVRELRSMGLIDKDGYVRAANYICLYVGDYDSSAWLYQKLPSMWDDPKRGWIPLGWAVNPTLARRFAFGMDYMRRNATQYDSFVAGDSGAGYINPGSLAEPRKYSLLPDGTEKWLKHCKKWYSRFDLSVTGFIIDGHAPKMTDEIFDAYAAFSPDGIGGQKLPSGAGVWKHAMPYKTMGDGNKFDDAERIAEYQQGELSFLYLRNIQWKPEKQLEYVNKVKKHNPDAVFLGPHEFFALIKYYYENGEKCRYTHVNLFKLSNIEITEHSAMNRRSDITDLFGGLNGEVETSAALFEDAADGYAHYVEFRTKKPAAVKRVVLRLRSDSGSDNRSVKRFRLLAGDSRDSLKEIVSEDTTPPGQREKYEFEFPQPVTAGFFRAEFIQPDVKNGPRILELEAYEE